MRASSCRDTLAKNDISGEILHLLIDAEFRYSVDVDKIRKSFFIRGAEVYPEIMAYAKALG